MSDLLIPYATNQHGADVPPDIAQKEDEYRCPQCGESVVFRKGDIKRPHFSHKPSSVCSAETVEHIVAKRAIAAMIKMGVQVDINIACARCGRKTVVELPVHVFDDALLETPLANKRIPDVSLMAGGNVMLGVEVRKTHAVDEDKSKSLGDMPWVEVMAADVIRHPATWDAVQHNLIATCNPCVQSMVTIRTIADRDDVAWDENTTTPEIINCWKCGAEILAFTWSGTRPANPMPWVVSYRWVQTTKSMEWVTFCPHCGQTQSSFFRGRDVAMWRSKAENGYGCLSPFYLELA